MKPLKFLLTALFIIALSIAHSQTKKTVTISLPDWGVAGVNNATYYYIPATETYYDIRNKEFVYMQNGKWKRSPSMPITYRDYDLYNGYKVVLTDGSEPFKGFYTLRTKYPITYHGELQATIRPKK